MSHLKRICKDAFSVAGSVQETSSSELLGGEGAPCHGSRASPPVSRHGIECKFHYMFFLNRELKIIEIFSCNCPTLSQHGWQLESNYDFAAIGLKFGSLLAEHVALRNRPGDIFSARCCGQNCRS